MNDNPSTFCSQGRHDNCTPCDCECHSKHLTDELLDLIKLMPDSQTQVIVDFIFELRAIRRMNK
jgi:hypothetical protein